MENQEYITKNKDNILKKQIFYVYLLSIVSLVLITGCSQSVKNTSIKHQGIIKSEDNKTIINFYGESITLSNEMERLYKKSMMVDYSFTPSSYNIIAKSKQKSSYKIDYEKEPQYYVKLDKPLIITKIQYIPSQTLFLNRNIINDSVNSVLSLPFNILSNVLKADSPLVSSVASLGLYKEDNNNYKGIVYDFKVEDKNNIVIKSPFNGAPVQNFALAIKQVWKPLTMKVYKRMKWNSGKIYIEGIDVSNTALIIDNYLRHSKNDDKNERLVTAILKKNLNVFAKLRKNVEHYNLPNISFLYLPNDADLTYAKLNKFTIFKKRIYRTLNGEFKTFKVKATKGLFDEEGEVVIKVKKINIKKQKVAFNKKDEKKTTGYIDFSEGL